MISSGVCVEDMDWGIIVFGNIEYYLRRICRVRRIKMEFWEGEEKWIWLGGLLCVLLVMYCDSRDFWSFIGDKIAVFLGRVLINVRIMDLGGIIEGELGIF